MKRPAQPLLVPAALLLICGACAAPKAAPTPAPEASIKVQIQSFPAEAIIKVDGKPLGKSPQTVSVKDTSGLLGITAEMGATKAIEKRIRFIAEDNVEVTFLFGSGKSRLFEGLGLDKKGYSGMVVFDYGAGYVFDVNKAEVKPMFKGMLDNQAALLKGPFDGVEVLVCGHTDSSGSKDRNLTLSLERATAVLSNLVERGVPISRLKAQGFGSQYPVTENDTPEGRAMNRRTEVILPTR